MDHIFKLLKGKVCQTKIPYVTKYPLQDKGEIKIFPGKQQLRKFVASNFTLQEILKIIF